MGDRRAAGAAVGAGGLRVADGAGLRAADGLPAKPRPGQRGGQSGLRCHLAGDAIFGEPVLHRLRHRAGVCRGGGLLLADGAAGVHDSPGVPKTTPHGGNRRHCPGGPCGQRALSAPGAAGYFKAAAIGGAGRHVCVRHGGGRLPLSGADGAGTFRHLLRGSGERDGRGGHPGQPVRRTAGEKAACPRHGCHLSQLWPESVSDWV